MKVALLSDTHGNMEAIENASRGVDAIVHAGDFGFYSDESYERLSKRELLLALKHSELSSDEKISIAKLDEADMRAETKRRRILGSFQDYIDGRKEFRVPVYAVWGNHDDNLVIDEILRRDEPIPNLNVVTPTRSYGIGNVTIYGIGGNFIPRKLFRKPVDGSGSIWITGEDIESFLKAWNWTEIVQSSGCYTGKEKRIFVSHVSPGRVPFIELIGARTSADYTVSGHMGVHVAMRWTPFSIMSLDEYRRKLEDSLDKVLSMCAAFIQHIPHVEDLRDYIGDPEPYRRMTHINVSSTPEILNLPD